MPTRYSKMWRRVAVRVPSAARCLLSYKPPPVICHTQAGQVLPLTSRLRCFSSDSVSAATGASIDVASKGVLVKVDMKMALPDGNVLDETPGVTFICGVGQMLSGVDTVVSGMRVGEIREATLTPADAFGEWDNELVVQVPLSELPPRSKAGDALSMADDGRAVITKIEGDTATVDHNHALAGKTVVFTAKLLECSKVPELRHEVQTPGDGMTFPKKGDVLTMHYIGSLASTGEVFDSSRGEGKTPFTFTIGIGQVISGWDASIMHMSLGERAILHIPSGLAYGGTGAGTAVPPNADLVFDVELLKIN